MTAEMRTRASLLAAELQRRRTDRSVRFTANTVFRTAIQVVLDQLELGPQDHVNSDAELRALVEKRLSSRLSNGPRS